MNRWAWLLAALAASAQAGDPLPPHEAAAWLQKMADAARRQAYEGVFVFQHGDVMQTLQIVNRPAGPIKESLLTAMDGAQRELHCRQGESVSVVSEGTVVRTERRLGSRHFPDLLPANAASLANWYAVRLGEGDRVAGMDCRWVELAPRDMFRWGYVLCAEKDSALPLKAMMVNESGQTLLQYAFTKVSIGANPRSSSLPKSMPGLELMPKQGASEAITVKQLPPGFTRVAAGKRTLPHKPNEVEHWVYSDGLTHVSLFIEPATRPVESVKGASPKGMMNLLTRQVGPWQVTVLGDAPWPTVEAIAMNLAERPK